MNDPMLTVKDLRARFGVAPSTIHAWIKRRAFPKPIKIGRYCLWQRADVRAWQDKEEIARMAKAADKMGKPRPLNPGNRPPPGERFTLAEVSEKFGVSEKKILEWAKINKIVRPWGRFGPWRYTWVASDIIWWLRVFGRGPYEKKAFARRPLITLSKISAVMGIPETRLIALRKAGRFVGSSEEREGEYLYCAASVAEWAVENGYHDPWFGLTGRPDDVSAAGQSPSAPVEPPRFIRPRELGEVCKVDRATIGRWIKDGALPPVTRKSSRVIGWPADVIIVWAIEKGLDPAIFDEGSRALDLPSHGRPNTFTEQNLNEQ